MQIVDLYIKSLRPCELEPHEIWRQWASDGVLFQVVMTVEHPILAEALRCVCRSHM